MIDPAIPITRIGGIRDRLVRMTALAGWAAKGRGPSVKLLTIRAYGAMTTRQAAAFAYGDVFGFDGRYAKHERIEA